MSTYNKSGSNMNMNANRLRSNHPRALTTYWSTRTYNSKPSEKTRLGISDPFRTDFLYEANDEFQRIVEVPSETRVRMVG